MGGDLPDPEALRKEIRQTAERYTRLLLFLAIPLAPVVGGVIPLALYSLWTGAAAPASPATGSFFAGAGLAAYLGAVWTIIGVLQHKLFGPLGRRLRSLEPAERNRVLREGDGGELPIPVEVQCYLSRAARAEGGEICPARPPVAGGSEVAAPGPGSLPPRAG